MSGRGDSGRGRNRKKGKGGSNKQDSSSKGNGSTPSRVVTKGGGYGSKPITPSIPSPDSSQPSSASDNSITSAYIHVPDPMHTPAPDNAKLVAEEQAAADAAEAARLVAEAERLEREKFEAEAEAKQKAEAEAAAEQERLEIERQAAAEKEEAERLEAERAENERLEAERIEAEKVEAEKLEAAKKEEQERLEAEQRSAEAEIEKQKAEQEKLEAAAEKLEAERLEAEKKKEEEERLEAERREAEQKDKAEKKAEEEASLAKELAEEEGLDKKHIADVAEPIPVQTLAERAWENKSNPNHLYEFCIEALNPQKKNLTQEYQISEAQVVQYIEHIAAQQVAVWQKFLLENTDPEKPDYVKGLVGQVNSLTASLKTYVAEQQNKDTPAQQEAQAKALASLAQKFTTASVGPSVVPAPVSPPTPVVVPAPVPVPAPAPVVVAAPPPPPELPPLPIVFTPVLGGPPIAVVRYEDAIKIPNDPRIAGSLAVMDRAWASLFG